MHLQLKQWLVPLIFNTGVLGIVHNRDVICIKYVFPCVHAGTKKQKRAYGCGRNIKNYFIAFGMILFCFGLVPLVSYSLAGNNLSDCLSIYLFICFLFNGHESVIALCKHISTSPTQAFIMFIGKGLLIAFALRYSDYLLKCKKNIRNLYMYTSFQSRQEERSGITSDSQYKVIIVVKKVIVDLINHFC